MGKGGRPKKTVKDTFKNWKTWKQDIIELYSEGASDVEIRALVWEKTGHLTEKLWYRWMEEEDEFCQTIKKGRALSQSWWERNGRKGLKDKEFNYTGWYMNMKNRFGWSDKKEIKKESNVSVDTWLKMFQDEEE